VSIHSDPALVCEPLSYVFRLDFLIILCCRHKGWC